MVAAHNVGFPLLIPSHDMIGGIESHSPVRPIRMVLLLILLRCKRGAKTLRDGEDRVSPNTSITFRFGDYGVFERLFICQFETTY